MARRRLPPCVGAKEIERMLGVNRQRVQQIVNSKGFPDPVLTLAMGKVWLAADVEQWARGKGRTIHDY